MNPPEKVTSSQSDVNPEIHEPQKKCKQISKLSRIIRACFVEFFACFICGFSAELISNVYPHNFQMQAVQRAICNCLLMIAFQHISGGHFNPAISIGMLLARNLNIMLALLFIVFQTVGYSFGSVLAQIILFLPEENTSMYIHVSDFAIWKIFLMETVFIGLLVVIFLVTVYDCEGMNILAPISVSACYLVGIMSSTSVSGVKLNPGMEISSILSGVIFHTKELQLCRNVYAPWCAALTGALIAVVLYRMIFANSKERWLLVNR